MPSLEEGKNLIHTEETHEKSPKQGSLGKKRE